MPIYLVRWPDLRRFLRKALKAVPDWRHGGSRDPS